MELETFTLEDGLTVIHRDGVVVAVLEDGQPVELREDGCWATVDLIRAVEALCRLRGWPEEAIEELERSVMHRDAPRVKGVGGPGLWGRVPFWDEEVQNG